MVTVLANKSHNFAAIRKFIVENECKVTKAFDMVYGKVEWSELESAIALDIFVSRSVGEIGAEVEDFIWRLDVYDDFYQDTVVISTNLPFEEKSFKQLRALANRIRNTKPKMKVLIGMVSNEDFGLMTIDKAVETLKEIS